MYQKGLLATVDVNKLVEAQVCVLEAMNKTASGRYICFDKVIEREEDAEKLAQQTNMSKSTICGDTESGIVQPQYRLSNTKLSSLMTSTLGRCYNQCHGQYK